MPTKRVRTKPTAGEAKSFLTADSYRNFMTATGLGSNNLSTGGSYSFSPISRVRVPLEYCYRSSWIAGMAVDSVADDMTRMGVKVVSGDKPEKQLDFSKSLQTLQVWSQIKQAIKWSRLYGGSIAMFMIDGQEPETPLRPETIKKDQFKGILPLDRWIVQPSLSSLVNAMGPCFGKPEFYETVADTIGGIPKLKIHYTRVIRFEGVELPHWQRISENLWGQSVLERVWDRLLAFDSTTSGIAQMVYKAHLRTYKVKGLREIIATGKKAYAGLLKQIDMIRQFQSNEGITLMDGSDEFEVHAYAFSGLADVMEKFAEQVSGALQIPMVRLLGQSPAGFSNGESDLRTYYDSIHQQQESALRPGIEVLYRLAYLSKFGSEPPKDWKLEFAPLWQLDEEKRANVTTASASAVIDAFNAGIINRSTALKELKQVADATGVFSNISDKDISDAETDDAENPLPSASELLSGFGNSEIPGEGRGGASKANGNGKGGKELQAGA